MTVAVTGGTGFLGAHLVRALLRSGEQVRVLARPGGDRQNLAGLAVEIVEGDLASRTSIPPGFPAEARALIHAAVMFEGSDPGRRTASADNATATERVFDAAARDGVRRVVHVSTMGTCAPSATGAPATERDRVVPGPGATAYVREKLAAEDRALARRDLDVVVVNPAALVGALDRKPSVTGARIAAILGGSWPRLPRGPVNHVSVTAVAEGILRALDRGRAGERYLLGGENLGPFELVDRVSALAGIRPPRPGVLARILGRAFAGPVNLAIDDSKARRELGYSPGALDDAFREAIAFFRGR